MLHKFQVKFYPSEKSSHITWGTEVKRIEFDVRGLETGGAAPYKVLAPTNISFK